MHDRCKLQNQYPLTNETARISRNLFPVFRVSCRQLICSHTPDEYERKLFFLLQIDFSVTLQSLTSNARGRAPQSQKLTTADPKVKLKEREEEGNSTMAAAHFSQRIMHLQ